MRISDWSSYVCSSDLPTPAPPHPNPSPEGEGLSDRDRPVTLAAIAGAHGVRGEVRLKLFGDGADTLRDFPVFDAGPRRLTLKSVRPANQGAVASFAEVTDRSAAEALRGRSEEHTSELQSLMRISYAVFCLKKKNKETT